MTRLILVPLCALALLAGCRHTPTPKECEGSDIHYDLAIQALNAHNMPEAYTEFDKALELCETSSRAHNGMGQLLHLGFHKPQEAIPHYQRALELDPTFTEVLVNLGNVYLDLGDYEKAIAQYEKALNDMRYGTPYIAQANLGWAEYKRGNVDKAVDALKSAVTLNPRFCLGYRNLGQIYEDTGKTVEACEQYGRYLEQCPEVAEAYYRSGVCEAKLGKNAEARDLFAQCEGKAPVGQLKDDCHRLGEQLK